MLGPGHPVGLPGRLPTLPTLPPRQPMPATAAEAEVGQGLGLLRQAAAVAAEPQPRAELVHLGELAALVAVAAAEPELQPEVVLLPEQVSTGHSACVAHCESLRTPALPSRLRKDVFDLHHCPEAQTWPPQSIKAQETVKQHSVTWWVGGAFATSLTLARSANA